MDGALQKQKPPGHGGWGCGLAMGPGHRLDGEGVFERCQPPRSAVLTDARSAYGRGQVVQWLRRRFLIELMLTAGAQAVLPTVPAPERLITAQAGGGQTWPRRPLPLCGMKPADPDLSCISLPSITRVNISWPSVGHDGVSAHRLHGCGRVMLQNFERATL